MIRLQACAEPIAIVGIGCRFPGGADTWQEFWHLLQSGMDAISETPAERWSLKKFYAPQATKPGKTQSRWGGYVRGIENFDPQLFGISPREAASMDPQQRMLLEVAFRALEDAGQPLERVAGQSVSVFVGISSFDYAVAGLSAQDPGVIDAYSNTGGSSSIAANRISYCFDLRGPSVAVDTACSSSLVAVHMACESLWRGEVPMALAGGVNALLLPDFYVAFSQLGVLSPDGRCKSFDARANGYVRSEGAGMVLLKPLATALRDKDPIYAVIRGTALNQDGRTPGMTVPSQAAQEELIRAACRNAGVMPQEIEYVEAHGTGTPVGDPIEAAAIGAVIGRARTANQPCTIGSVKTNIGHLEAGAGIASLIKVALALHHRHIPAHLHFQQANPAIDWEGLHLRIPRVAHDWQSTGKRLAGINGFGYGGANAHVIVEQAPQGSGLSTSGTVASLHRGGQRAPSRTVHAGSPKGCSYGLGAAGKAAESHFSAPVVLPLSARTPQALSMGLQQWLQWLERHGEDFSLAEVAGFLAHRRSHHACRVALTATNLVDMLSELRNLAANSVEELTRDNNLTQLVCGPVFVCSGQGPQWWGMGRGLLKYSATFRSLIKRCDVEFAKYGKWSLLKELTRSEHESQMHKTSLAQPSIFAIQVALAAMWESWGVRPTAVVGHSVGEIAAAYLTGGLSFEDAARVAFHRGRTMDLASSQGAMLAAGLAPPEVPQWLDGIETEVSVAAINGPTSVTISGAAQAIEVLSQRLEQAGVFCRRLAVEYAFHSAQMEPVREELLQALASIEPRATHTQFISTVTGHTLPGTELGAEYWWRNVRQSVRFSQAMDCLASQGYALAIEIGPHPVLAYAIHECFQAAGRAVTSLPSLNRQQDDLQCITQSLGKLYALGVDIQWSGFYNQPERRLDIPPYPFQSQPCWSESLESRVGRLTAEVHPLLGCPMLSPQPQWQQRIDLKLQTYLSAHRVRGAAVYPAAAILETALAAVGAISQEAQPAPTGLHLQRIRLHQPCVLGDNHPQWIQTSLDLQRRQLQLNFRPCDESQWSPLASLEISSQPTSELQADLESGFAERVTQIRNRCTDHFDAQRLYDHCRHIGLQYGQAFQGVVRGQRRAGEAMLEINLPLSDLESQNALQDYLLHPRLLDSCFHGMIAADPNFDHTVDGLYLPAEIQQVVWLRRPTQRLTAIVVCPYKSSQLMRCDVEIYDEAGRLCMLLRGFESRRVSGGQALETTADLLYGYEWIEQPLQSTASPQSPPGRHWIVFMDQAGLGCSLSAQLTGRGERVVEIYHDASRTGQMRPGGGRWVDPSSIADLQRVLQEAAEELEHRVDELVYLWGLDVPRVACLTADRLDESTLLTSLAPVRIVQAWEQWAGASPAGFKIVTSGAQSGDGQPDLTEVAQAPLIGLGRVVASEVNRLRTKLIDLAVELTDADIRRLTDELLTVDEEDEVRLRDGRRWVHRFHPQAGKPVSADVAASLPCRLHVGHTAGIEELHYQVTPTPAPQAGEVEIAVVASGLNFSDVMKGLALYPGLPDGPVELGAECSGTISRVGPDSRWAIGDEVIAIAPGSFATHVMVSQDLVARKPRQLTHQQAAGIPIAFLTAHYALHECAGLQPGESVLIHAASGGVGLAAMQLSRLVGAKIFATAGNEEKRRLVWEAGASLVMDSRSLLFGQQTLAATDGVGVDVVLNSLPSEAIPVGLSTLKPGGRFLEIGKRDIYNDSPLGLFPFRNNLALFAIDLDQLFKQQPQRMGALLRRLVERFERGELQPLPTHVFAADETTGAYRWMQQGKHVGKVVVDYQQRPSEVRAAELGPPTFDANATFWLAGGLGGFGLEVARWLAQRGVRSLVLSGRNVLLSAVAQRVVEELQRDGVQVTLLPCDITLASDVRQVLETIDEQLPALRGVVHTAMVLEDKLLVDLDAETLQRVLRPKLLGGWNLHRETLGRELDYFILFSSLSSIFGHAGQANYSAANAALDSLAYYRRAQGLPATVINWGHLGEVGYLAQRTQLGERLERQGVLSFTVQQAMACLEYALQNKSVQMSVLRIDWSVWRGLGLTQRVSPRFAHLLRSTQGEESAVSETLTAASLRGLPPERQIQAVESLLRVKAGSLLGIAPDKIPGERGLLEMGLDSLMAVELRNWIEGQLEINMPISSLMRSNSLQQLMADICSRITDAALVALPKPVPPAGPTVSDAQAAELLARLPELGEQEVQQLLSQMLREG